MNELAIVDYNPGYAETFTQLGKERGFSPITRTRFDAQNGLLRPNALQNNQQNLSQDYIDYDCQREHEGEPNSWQRVVCLVFSII